MVQLHNDVEHLKESDEQQRELGVCFRWAVLYGSLQSDYVLSNEKLYMWWDYVFMMCMNHPCGPGIYIGHGAYINCY